MLLSMPDVYPCIKTLLPCVTPQPYRAFNLLEQMYGNINGQATSGEPAEAAFKKRKSANACLQKVVMILKDQAIG